MLAVQRAAALLTAVAVTVAMAACGNPAPGGAAAGPPASTQAPSTQPQYNPQPYENLRDGGTLTTSLPEISPQLNVFHGNTTAYSLSVWNWYNPVLVTFSPTGDVQFNRDYLTDVRPETVDGRTRITYTLDPRAVYNDGTPIDWTAFEAVWKASSGTDPAYLVNSTDGYSGIVSVTPGVDPRQAVVTFGGTNVWWQGLFNTLLHPKALPIDTFNQGYVENPHPEWGAGPYRVSSYDKQNGSISFTRNESWWGDRGKLDARTFLALETSARINAFKNGQLDVASVAAQDQLAQVQGMSGIEIRKALATQSSLLMLNASSPALSDPLVRKAVFEGIDRDQIGRIFFQGLDFSAAPPGSLMLFPFQDGYRDNFSAVLRYDAEQARRDLDAAGWMPGPDGVRIKGGAPLEFTYVNAGDDAIGKATASALVAMMSAIGVRLNIRQVPSNEFSAIITDRRFDMFFTGFVSSDPFGMAYLCQVYCSDSQLNLSATAQPAFDAEVKAVGQLPTSAEQIQRGNEVEVEALRTYGVMPVLNPVAIVAVKQGLANYGAGLYFTPLPQNVGYQKG